MTDTKWHAQYPELGTGPVPIEPYMSPEYFELERERIFRRMWLNVGREEEVPNPGDYLVKDLPVWKTSVVVVRGQDGRIRAFHNVCSHRGNKLAWDQGGSCQMFACKFHGWTYNLEGRLTFVPDEENFFDLKKETLGLTPVAADTWEGFIFLHLDPRPEESLREFLGEFGKDLSGYPFAQLSATRYTWTAEVDANWKILKDGFQEAFHVAFLHKRSVPDAFTSKSNPYSHSPYFKLYPRHHRTSVYGNREHRPTAVEMLTYRFGMPFRDELAANGLPPGVNPTRDPSWFFDLNVVFPNFFVDAAAGFYFTYNFWPLAVDRTRWEVRLYFPRAENAGQQFSLEYNKVLFRDVLLEDASTSEKIQCVLASGAKTHFILHDQELLIRHDLKVIEDCVGFYRQGAGGATPV